MKPFVSGNRRKRSKISIDDICSRLWLVTKIKVHAVGAEGAFIDDRVRC